MKKSALFFATLFLMALICTLGCTAVRADDEEVIDNGIPVVYINIDESQGTVKEMMESMDHSVYCYGTLSIDVPEGFSYSDFSDVELESIDGIGMSIRGRGNSTWVRSDKKPFKIKLDTKTDILGLGANKHWVLLANSQDSTLIKDRITAWLGDQMDFDFTPRGVPVDLVLTGETYGTHYLGSYYLSENVRVDGNRLDIAELDEDDTDSQVITGGYLIQNSLQVRQGSPDRFITSRGAEWATNTPSFDTEGEENSLDTEGEESFNGAELGDAYKNNEQQEYIQNYIQEFENVLFEDGTDYRDLMDVETAAKYWLINMIPLNQDAYATGSTYLYKDRDTDEGVSKLYWGPVWDFDFAWNYNAKVTGFSYGHLWMKPLFYDTGEGGFVQELHEQWPALREALEELIEDGGVIDQYYKETKKSAEADYELYHEDKTFDYKEKVEELKTWIRERIDWVDDNFYLLDDMVNKVTYVADGEKFATDFVATGEYLTGDAKYPEKEGYTFLGWADEDGNIIDSPTYLTEDITLTAQYIADSEVTHGADIALRKDSDITGYNSFFSTYSIQFEVVPADAFDQKVEWTSSDESIAVVDERGLVKYYSPGTVTFTGKLRLGKTRTFTLTITKDDMVYAQSITPAEETIELKPGQYSALYICTDPSPAKLFDYEYVSDDENVVSVDEFGGLTAHGTGSTVVHVKAVSYDDDGEELHLETSVVVNVKADEPESESTSKSEPETASKSSGESTSETAAAANKSAVPKTGDHGIFWIMIMAAAAATLAGAFWCRWVKRQ